MGYIEETHNLEIDFNKIADMQGEQKVIPVAVQHYKTKEVILIAYTNAEAFLQAVKEHRAIFWSTSRNELWYKGKTSGNEFELMEVRINC